MPMMTMMTAIARCRVLCFSLEKLTKRIRLLEGQEYSLGVSWTAFYGDGSRGGGRGSPLKVRRGAGGTPPPEAF